ncbi:MAG: acyl-CoA synthetase, partial [Lactobacillaceae bacterium]
IIFTSGSSGKSKGIVHSTGGFLFGTMMTIQLNLGFKGETDIFLSTADIGWLACVSHSIYGPLLCGGTTVVLEGNPFYPNYFRIFEIINKYNVTHLYTAPTVLRMIQQHCQENNLKIEHISKLYNMSSLKIIGCVGEILTERSMNFIKKLTNHKVFIINTYWQTETGTIMLSQIPVKDKNMPGVGLPVYFVIPKIVKINVATKGLVECKPNEKGILLFSSKWPSLAKTLLNEHSRFQEAYFNVFPNFYYTGDEASKDENGNFYILGRVDDVINVSGHRLSTLEIENTLSLCEGISELAVVGIPDEITGQKICIYAVKLSHMTKEEVTSNIKKCLMYHFGRILGKYEIKWMRELPKTKTGKILRRLLRCQQNLH